MLRWRLIGAITIVAPVLGLLWLDGNLAGGRPGIWLLPLGLAMVASTCGELHRLSPADESAGRSTFKSISLGVIVFTIAVLPILLPRLQTPTLNQWSWTAVAIMVGLMYRMLLAVSDFRQGLSVTAGIGIDLFHAIYAVLPLMFLLHLRLAWSDARGLWAIASIPWITKISDAAAYFAGRNFGRLPLAPRLSPKKTWEGAIGGILAATVASLLFFYIAGLANSRPFAAEVSWIEIIVFGAVIAVAGIFGDLAESLLKRDAGQKDSSSWLPGLGGALDILDSIMWAAPVGYLCWMLWLERGL